MISCGARLVSAYQESAVALAAEQAPKLTKHAVLEGPEPRRIVAGAATATEEGVDVGQTPRGDFNRVPPMALIPH